MMADIKQKLDDIEAVVEKAATSETKPVTPPAAGRVRMRQPNTGDVKDVDATVEALVPLMVQGYQQVKG